MRKTVSDAGCLCFCARFSVGLRRPGEDMDTLAENLQVVQKTSDAGELKAALNKMRTAASMLRKRPRRSWKAKRPTALR